MTRELLTALFQDDIFQYGLAFGLVIGFVLGYIIDLIDNHYINKLFKHKEEKDKWQYY